MKVFHLASEYPPQDVFGLGRYVHDLAREQACQGHGVHVVTNSMGGSDREVCRDGVHLHRIDFPPPPKPHVETAAVCQFNSLLLERLPEIVASHGAFDVVNSHDWLTALAGEQCSRLFGPAHVWTVHDLVVGKQRGNLSNEDKFVANLERWAAGVADGVICNSAYVRDELVRTYSAPPGCAAVVPCAVSEETFVIETPDEHLSFFRKTLADPEEPLVLYVGRLDTEKGVDVLFNAVVRVLREEPKARFVLAGKGNLEAQIRQDVAEEPLRGRVKVLGYVGHPALAHLYRVADMQVVPSKYEPFGIVALEGMVNGLPVVVADTGGLRDVVDDGEDGLKFPAEDHEALASIILRLMRDPGTRERLGAAGRRKARERYSWKAVAEAVLAHYQAVLRTSLL